MQEFDAPRSLNTDKTMGFHSAKHRVSSELGDVSYLHSEWHLVVNQVNTQEWPRFVFCIPRHSLRCHCTDCDRRLCPVHTECRKQTLNCNLEQHLVHNTCSSAAALTGQVLLQVTVHCNLRTTSIEKTFRIQNIEVHHLYWSLVTSHCSCVIAGAAPSFSVLLLR